MILIDWLLVALTVAFVIFFRRAVFTSAFVACAFFGVLITAALFLAATLIITVWAAFKAEVTK